MLFLQYMVRQGRRFMHWMHYFGPNIWHLCNCLWHRLNYVHLLRFSNFFKKDITPNWLFGNELSFQKYTTTSNKHFSLSAVIEVIALGLFRITYEETLINFGSKIYKSKHFTLASQTQICWKNKLVTFPLHISYGIFSTVFDKVLLSVRAEVLRPYPQKDNIR